MKILSVTNWPSLHVAAYLIIWAAIVNGAILTSELDEIQNAELNRNETHKEISLLDNHGSVHHSLSSNGYESENTSNCHNEHEGIHLISLRWREVGVYYTITAFVIIAGLAKLGFHHMHYISSKVPESCILVILGVILGLLIFFTSHETDPEITCHHHVELPQFTSELFFFVLLPPIVLESAYSLHDRSFFDNLGTVLVYAIIGTCMNVFAIGPTLYGAASIGAMGNITLTFKECMVFSSLIAAVDPVAVLAIFQELGVNKDLYFLVFGESLLNDGVTVVLYNTMSVFLKMDDVGVGQYALAVASFFMTSLGGMLIGVIFGCLTSLVTKSTTEVRVVEPLALLGLGYLSYLTAELFHFSGIVCLIACGLVQAQYAFQNISQKSYTCVKYFTKMASATSDTIIFMFLGMVLVSDKHVWHTGFVLWTVFLCLLFRFIAVFLLTGIMNHYRLKKIGMEEQFIAAYGGLRGAVSFSLVIMINDGVAMKPIFITTTLVVVLFTIFVQGITIKPLVTFLHIQLKQDGKKSLSEEVNDTAMDHIMAGIEEILGQHGDFYLRELLIHYNTKYLKKWFLRPKCDGKLTRLFEKIAISEHYAHLYGPAAMIEDKVTPLAVIDKKQRVSGILTGKEEVILKPRPSIAEIGQDGLVELRRKSTRKQHGRKKSLLPIRRSRIVSDTSWLSDGEKGDKNAQETLRKAFKNHSYNKLHYKYNPNLIGEEEQEMAEHLHRRHINARRMTRLASSTRISNLPGEVNRPKTGDFGTADDWESDDVLDESGVEKLITRARNRSICIRNRRPPLQSCFSLPADPDVDNLSPHLLEMVREASHSKFNYPELQDEDQIPMTPESDAEGAVFFSSKGNKEEDEPNENVTLIVASKEKRSSSKDSDCSLEIP